MYQVVSVFLLFKCFLEKVDLFMMCNLVLFYGKHAVTIIKK